jgi:hypothetical protein
MKLEEITNGASLPVPPGHTGVSAVNSDPRAILARAEAS